HARPARGRDVHQEARAHHRVEGPRPPRRGLQVGAQEPERVVALARHLEHGGRDVGADDTEAPRRQVAADDAGAARHVEHEPAAVHAREMLRSGAWLVPARPEGELARKPPLYYWAAAGALGVLPERPELALRLPSAVLGTAAVLGTWATARAVWGAAAGLPAALVLAT